MERAVFRDKITGSNSSGQQKICYGLFEVYCDVIPDDAPQDWELGPKQTPGHFGLYTEHLYYRERHGRYAFAVAATPEDCKAMAPFKEKVEPWHRAWPQGEEPNPGC